MDTYFRLTDGILNVIKEQVEDEELQKLIDGYDRSKFFIPIGYVRHYKGTLQDLKTDVMKHSGIIEGELKVDDIIVDPIKSGYDLSSRQSMFYISTDGSIQQWTNEWKQPPPDIFPTAWRVFLTKRDKALVNKVKSGLTKVITGITGFGSVYEEGTDIDYIPDDNQ
ncbi:PREDICTED: uncharacterized protein LOC109584017 [Amphimedon queenslandica]|nr:PREDICTED: uncharacterized protein LOC109584017 [Amphimedon queenslandica]|eukprot:XP_019855138.1 PREDICTED: uncharacterized protein LOC109584017 [Amphimedon queenslandica]